MTIRASTDYADALRDLTDFVEHIGRRFTKPTAAWAPFVVLNGPRPAYVALAGRPRSTWPAAIDEVLPFHPPAYAGFVASTWTVAGKPVDLRTAYDAGERNAPEREEWLTIEFSDGLRREVWVAPVTRSADALPALGIWRQRSLAPTEPLLVDHAFASGRPA